MAKMEWKWQKQNLGENVNSKGTNKTQAHKNKASIKTKNIWTKLQKSKISQIRLYKKIKNTTFNSITLFTQNMHYTERQIKTKVKWV